MRHMGVYLSLLWVSGVYGSSAEPEKVLKCSVGGKIIFQAAVKNKGVLTRVQDKKQIAKVKNKTFTGSGRVQWDSSTGFFSITGLKVEDSGAYRVQDTDGQSKEYQLTVYNPVSTPQVCSRNKMKPTCSVLCSVENGREVTLSWQREGETLNSTSSPDLNTPLSLPLEIEENSAPYSCVAVNPVSEERTNLNTSEICRVGCSDQRKNKGAGNPMAVIGPGVGAGIGVLVILLGILIYLKKKKKTSETEDSPEDLTYANINHGARNTQRENAQMGQTGKTAILSILWMYPCCLFYILHKCHSLIKINWSGVTWLGEGNETVGLVRLYLYLSCYHRYSVLLWYHDSLCQVCLMQREARCGP
ncbi:hypothetical protein AGOR_G00195560 [Albula goreensis]|uniref:Ig-like domain-containing protein n=1 Tax=Albula goreensis TaxID=1534307 RepID=A0A8T3CW01_9TELE|nr:hypothetical protein AGOR_G00195560 [Albula goreensis]